MPRHKWAVLRRARNKSHFYAYKNLFPQKIREFVVKKIRKISRVMKRRASFGNPYYVYECMNITQNTGNCAQQRRGKGLQG